MPVPSLRQLPNSLLSPTTCSLRTHIHPGQDEKSNKHTQSVVIRPLRSISSGNTNIDISNKSNSNGNHHRLVCKCVPSARKRTLETIQLIPLFLFCFARHPPFLFLSYLSGVSSSRKTASHPPPPLLPLPLSTTHPLFFSISLLIPIRLSISISRVPSIKNCTEK